MKDAIKVGRVVIPAFAIIRAVPAAIRAAKAEIAEAKEDGNVTPEEILEVVTSVCTAIAEAALPAILRANGIPL